VLDSILMFAGLLSGGADYNWAHWAGALPWSSFGNLVVVRQPGRRPG
jgi:hypothetical protein